MIKFFEATISYLSKIFKFGADNFNSFNDKYGTKLQDETQLFILCIGIWILIFFLIWLIHWFFKKLIK